MDISFLATPDLEERLARLGVSGLIRATTIDGLLDLRGAEISRIARPAANPRMTAGLIAGCMWGHIEPALDERLQAAARGLAFPLSGLPPYLHATELGDCEIVSWILGRLGGLASASALETSRAGLQLGRMRVMLEQSESSLRQMEEYAPIAGGTALLFQILPNGLMAPLPVSFLEQWVARRGGALHGFDLMLELGPGLSNVSLLAELIGANTGRSIARWRVLESSLRNGWNRFDCPVQTEASDEPIVIRVRAEVAGSRIKVGRGDERSAASLDGAAPIALRLWGGVLGVRTGRSGIGHLAVGEATGEATRQRSSPAPASDLLTLATPVDPSLTALVGWASEVRCLRVHPNGTVPVAAILSGLKSNGLVGLQAIVTLAHPEAAATEFALFACRSGSRPDFLRDARRRKTPRLLRWLSSRPKPGPGADGLAWLLLQANETGAVSFRADEPLSGDIDVYFVTRNLDRGSRYSWALFKSLTAEYVEPIRAPSAEAA